MCKLRELYIDLNALEDGLQHTQAGGLNGYKPPLIAQGPLTVKKGYFTHPPLRRAFDIYL